MKKILSIIALALATSAPVTFSQTPSVSGTAAATPQTEQGKGGGRLHRQRPPLIGALDANGDGVIDAQEIANAPAALKALDKNGDGQLTRDEFRRQHGPAGAGEGQPRKHGKKHGVPAPSATPAASVTTSANP